MAGDVLLENLLGGWEEWQNLAGQPSYCHPVTRQILHNIPANCVDQPGVSDVHRAVSWRRRPSWKKKKLNRSLYGRFTRFRNGL